MYSFDNEIYPRHGAEVIVHKVDGTSFRGQYDNGGARNKHNITSLETGKMYILPTKELLTWKYTP